MTKPLNPKELRQYPDGELPADVLAEYPIAKQHQLESPANQDNLLAYNLPNEIQQRGGWILLVVIFGGTAALLPEKYFGVVCVTGLLVILGFTLWVNMDKT